MANECDNLLQLILAFLLLANIKNWKWSDFKISIFSNEKKINYIYIYNFQISVLKFVQKYEEKSVLPILIIYF